MNMFDLDGDWIRGLADLAIRSPADIAARTAGLIAAVADSKAVVDNVDYSSQLDYLLNHFDADDAARTARVLVAALGREKDPTIRWWLAAGICVMVEKMDPGEAARVCSPVVEILGKSLATSKPSDYEEFDLRINAFAVVASRQTPAVVSRSARVLAGALAKSDLFSVRFPLSKGLATVVGGMEPIETARVCGESARALADALQRQPSDSEAAQGLAVLAGRMEPVEAERTCGAAARVLAGVLQQQPDDYWSARNLAVLAGRMQRVEAERICGAAARNLSNLLGRDRDAIRINCIANLIELATRMEPVEAARVLAEVLGWQIDGAARITDARGLHPGWAHRQLAEALSAATARMEPGAAARVCDSTIRSLLRSRSAKPRDAEHRSGFDSSVAELLPRLEARKASAQATILAAVICSEGDIHWDREYDPLRVFEHVRMRSVLSRVLTDTSQKQRDLRALRVAMPTIGLGMGALPAAMALETEPWPCRLTTQELVDLLKMPTCYGKARLVVLYHLGNIHGRRFANHWEFVRFAQENHLSLDFTTPPRRPDPAALAADLAPPKSK